MHFNFNLFNSLIAWNLKIENNIHVTMHERKFLWLLFAISILFKIWIEDTCTCSFILIDINYPNRKKPTLKLSWCQINRNNHCFLSWFYLQFRGVKKSVIISLLGTCEFLERKSNCSDHFSIWILHPHIQLQTTCRSEKRYNAMHR